MSDKGVCRTAPATPGLLVFFFLIFIIRKKLSAIRLRLVDRGLGRKKWEVSSIFSFPTFLPTVPIVRVTKRCDSMVTQNFSEIAQDFGFGKQKLTVYYWFTLFGI